MMLRVEGLAAILPAGTWSRLILAGRARLFRSGNVLVRQGDLSDHVVLVLHGRVKVSMVDTEGNIVLLAVRGPGELIGELGVLGGGDMRRSATVTAMGYCSTRIIPCSEFRAATGSLGFGEQLLQHMVQRQHEGDDVRAELSWLQSGPRIARCLLRLALLGADDPASRPDEIDVGLNQVELSQAVGLHRSTVADELKRLREDGIVRTAGRHIVIVDLAALRKKAGE